jgi:hypothetical protein
MSIILYSFPYILYSAFPRHLLEIRIYVRDNSSPPNLSKFPAFFQRTFNYRCTRKCSAWFDKARLLFNGLLSRYCQKKKCAEGVKGFNSNARFTENICCLHLVHTRLLFQYKATSRQLRQTSFYKRHKRRSLE